MSSSFEILAEEARLLKASHMRVDPASYVLGLLLGMSSSGKTDAAKAKETPISEVWLAEVAKLPSISAKGLSFLAQALTDKGWVSVFEAAEFVDMEQTVRKNRMRAKHLQGVMGPLHCWRARKKNFLEPSHKCMTPPRHSPESLGHCLWKDSSLRRL